MEEQKRNKGRSRRKRSRKTLILYWVGILIFGCMFCVSAFMAGRDIFAAKKEASAFESLSNLAAEYAETSDVTVAATKNETENTETGIREASQAEPETETEAEKPVDRQKEAAGYALLKNQNEDYVGWLTIPGTKISYPVMNRTSDPEYYLHRAFDGSSSYGGTPFLGDGYGADEVSVIIYGHNMKNGSMFGTLDHYKKKNFWSDHREIVFYVNGEVRTYEVFAAVESQLLYEDQEGFRYYRANGDISEEEYVELVSWLKENSDYNTGITPQYSEQILMLSTCSYHTEDGRFVVAARRVS